MTEAMPLWEVFIRPRNGLAHRHVGSLHAADEVMALQAARDVYTRRGEGTSIWVVPLGGDHRERSRPCRRDVRADGGQDLPPPDLLRDPRRSGAHVMADRLSSLCPAGTGRRPSGAGAPAVGMVRARADAGGRPCHAEHGARSDRRGARALRARRRGRGARAGRGRSGLSARRAGLSELSAGRAAEWRFRPDHAAPALFRGVHGALLAGGGGVGRRGAARRSPPRR